MRESSARLLGVEKHHGGWRSGGVEGREWEKGEMISMMMEMMGIWKVLFRFPLG
jgi:hypothetical protein